MNDTKESELLVLELMFGDYQKRNLAYNALYRRGFDGNVLSKLNRKGELQTGLKLENFEYLQDNRLQKCPRCGDKTMQEYNRSVFKATANTIIADVKAFFNRAKAKAIIISGDIGLPSKASDKVDTFGAGFNLRITKNEITPSGSMMVLSAGAQFDEKGNANTVLGMAGLAEVNPKTGSFDLSIPTGAGGIINAGHDIKTNDTEIGIGAGVKKIFEISINAAFNFRENVEESRLMRQKADKNLENSMMMKNER